MIEFALHPNVYSTGSYRGLRNILEDIWVRTHRPGDGTIYIVSGFANYNGGARFYRVLREHTENGGRVVAYFGGSTQQRLTSKQVVEALLECDAEVNVINRKRYLHAKCYGTRTEAGETLVVSSGNFTAPGMSQNIEASIVLTGQVLAESQFAWDNLLMEMGRQNWRVYRPTLADRADPSWQLLYDESPGAVRLDESEEVTLVLVLGHSDTARIQAQPGTERGKGTQYFWLSKDSFDFFPPLTIRNRRGIKGTLSALVELRYVDIGVVDQAARVTFEAENNLDFRLGTGMLKFTGVASRGDLAVISRIGEAVYELRIIQQNTPTYDLLRPYAVTDIGHRGKQYGYIDNDRLETITDFRINT